MSASRNCLIVLCAGEGKRMGHPVPKMLLPVCGRPILFWTLKNLESCAAVGSLILAVPPLRREAFERNLAHWRFRKVREVVDGGAERADSTRNALARLPASCRWVGIHDGARPFVAAELVQDCFQAARAEGCAVLAVPCKDTVKLAAPARRGAPLRIQKTLPRQLLWAAQTPQVFRRDIAEEIHLSARARAAAPAFTDDASLAEAFGFKVRIVPGSYANLKITTPEDIALAEAILRKHGR